MKRLIALCLCAACLTTQASAGGPVVVVGEPDPEVTEAPPSSKGWLPLLVVPLFLCLVLCGPDDDAPPDQ